MAINAVVFDAYGTLLDVAGAARRAAREPGGKPLADIWVALSDLWRQKQLAYTWLRSLTREHADFRQVTEDALDWAMEATGLTDPVLRSRLLALYDELPAYPEVPGVLRAIRKRSLPVVILSNGAPSMLTSALSASGIDGLIDAVISVERVGVYKPHPSVYRLVTDQLSRAPESILYVSANGWDAAGAAGFGYRSVWLNRLNEPQDRLPGQLAHVIHDLTVVPGLL